MRSTLTAVLLCLAGAVLFGARAEPAVRPDPAELEHELEIAPPGGDARRTDLADALRALRVPSASLALIDGGRLAWARAYGAAAGTLSQAASLSKLVAAVAALRLVQDQRLDLDADVNRALRSWKVPASELARE